MKFPEWAPAGLIAARSFISFRKGDIDSENLADEANPISFELSKHYLSKKSHLALIDKLLLEPRMKGVWVALKKRFDKEGLDYSARLWQQIIWEDALWMAIPKYSRAQILSARRKVAKQAEALAELLWETNDYSLQFVPELMSDESWDTLHELLKPRRHSERAESIPDETYVEQAIVQALPSLPSLLERVATVARTGDWNGRTVRKPLSTDARTKHFIEVIANYILEEYRTPLHAHVATICNVVLGARLSEEKVRLFMLQKRRTKPSSSGTREKKPRIKRKSHG